jgi:GNAT superfamily N-acetyltransferase
MTPPRGTPARPTTAVEVRALTSEHLDAAVDVLARGFAEEPGMVALLPDAASRATMLQVGARLELRRAMPLGTVYVALVNGHVGGIAVWHPPAKGAGSLSGLSRPKPGRHTIAARHREPASPPAHKASVLLGHSRQALPLALARRRAVARAKIGTSWHLAFLATAPEFRGRGLARWLLDRQLLRCDQDGTPAWLPGLWVMRREPANQEQVE